MSCFGGKFYSSHADIISVVYCKAGPSEVYFSTCNERAFSSSRMALSSSRHGYRVHETQIGIGWGST